MRLSRSLVRLVSGVKTKICCMVYTVLVTKHYLNDWEHKLTFRETASHIFKIINGKKFNQNLFYSHQNSTENIL